MKKLIPFHTCLCAAFLAAAVQPALATTSNQTFVSSSGTDTGTCPMTAPCATFQYAYNQTNAGGEIDCLSGGNFGPVTITGSITIDCGASKAGTIAITSGNAITLNTSAGAVVTLRNLNLNGLDNANSMNGIETQAFTSGKLFVQHCEIHGFTGGLGIDFFPSSQRGLLEVSDTRVYDNGINGIGVDAASGVIASAVLNNVELTANGFHGLTLVGAGVVAGTLRQSVSAENQLTGLYTDAGQVFFTIEESSLIDNLNVGVDLNSSGSNVGIGRSTIGGNGLGLSANPGTLFSFGNNQMSANGSNGSFTSTMPLE